MKTLTFDEFKTKVITDENFNKEISSRSDIVDMDNGTMVIYIENINKYLEKYACKNADDLQNTLWFSYGVFVNIIE